MNHLEDMLQEVEMWRFELELYRMLAPEDIKQRIDKIVAEESNKWDSQLAQ